MTFDPNTPENGSNGTDNYKNRRPVTLLATIGLIGVTGGAITGLVYDAIVNGNPPSITQLGTISTLGLGGILALAGGRSKNGGE